MYRVFYQFESKIILYIKFFVYLIFIYYIALLHIIRVKPWDSNQLIKFLQNVFQSTLSGPDCVVATETRGHDM